MNIDKFQHQHEQIFNCIDVLRELSTAGIAQNARRIADMVVSMSSIIKLHLAVEDKVLYPALQQSDNAALARMGDQYQVEMKSIATTYERFVRRWNTASNVAQDPDGFRAEANQVLRTLHARIKREDRDFYPEIATQMP
jgi:hemerythrin-like domain-containing protein